MSSDGNQCISSHFQSTEITKLSAPVPNAVGYADDWLLAAKTSEEIKRNTEQAVRLLHKRGMKINWKKSVVDTDEIAFLGHVISAENGIKPDPIHVRAINQMPVPKNKSELHTYLRMMNYLRDFIENMVEHTAPLHDLLRNDVNFDWTVQHEECFKALKHKTGKRSVLGSL